MLIAGYNPNSYVDYPSNIAAVIFLGGCNFNCFYCHNKDIITDAGGEEEDEILAKIKKRADFLDAVVITGGEPTLRSADEINALIAKIKEMGLKVKLDTNGSRPEVLRAVKADYIAMDIKAPLDSYRAVTPVSDEDLNNIKESIDYIKERGGEFRTTVYPGMTLEDITEIAKTLSGGKTVYYLQKMRATDYMEDKREVSPGFLTRAAEEANKYIPTFTRGI